MGTASSIQSLPQSEEEALAKGFTQEQIDIFNKEQKKKLNKMDLLARHDQAVFKVVLSHLDNLFLLESVQLVSRDVYDAIPGMIEGLDPLAMTQLKKLSPLLKRNKKSDEMLNMFLNLSARCKNLRVVNFRNQTHLCGSKISRALARCSCRLEALNLSQCIALTR